MPKIIQNVFLLLLSQINNGDMQKQKIIYIDDELINLSLFHINFRDRFDIIISESPVKAIEIIREQNIKVIITDYKMPVMNGMEFMEHLRESSDFDETPVIVVSTEGSKERKEELFDKNIKAYLRKPIAPEELANKVNEILGAS